MHSHPESIHGPFILSFAFHTFIFLDTGFVSGSGDVTGGFLDWQINLHFHFSPFSSTHIWRFLTGCTSDRQIQETGAFSSSSSSSSFLLYFIRYMVWLNSVSSRIHSLFEIFFLSHCLPLRCIRYSQCLYLFILPASSSLYSYLKE